MVALNLNITTLCPPYQLPILGSTIAVCGLLKVSSSKFMWPIFGLPLQYLLFFVQYLYVSLQLRWLFLNHFHHEQSTRFHINSNSKCKENLLFFIVSVAVGVRRGVNENYIKLIFVQIFIEVSRWMEIYSKHNQPICIRFSSIQPHKRLGIIQEL